LWSGDIPFEAIRRGAEIIEEKLDDAAPAVKDAMEWLRGLAKLMGKAPIKWRTPAGFEVTHYYPELVTRDIKTTRHTHTIRTGEVNREKVRGKQKTAMAPNFVHSLDAAALAETVTLASSKYGITSFSVVHDSYATTAAQTEDLRKAIADRFKWLYTEHTPLEDLRARVVEALPGVEVPGVPSGDGKLDLSRLSPYFCS